MRLALPALALFAACSVSEAGKIPCADDSSCPRDYPSCQGGVCVESSATQAAATLTVVGVDGHGPSDLLRGIVVVEVAAKAPSGIKALKLAGGSASFTPRDGQTGPVFAFDVDTSKTGDGDISLVATISPGDGSADVPSAAFTIHVDNTAPAFTSSTLAPADARDGSLVAIDVTTSEKLSAISAAVSLAGAPAGVASEIAPTTDATPGEVRHLGFAVTPATAGGSYSVDITGTDLAGNASLTLTKTFKVRKPFTLTHLVLAGSGTSGATAGGKLGAAIGLTLTLPATVEIGSSTPVFTLTDAAGTTRTFAAANLAGSVAGDTRTFTASDTVSASDASGLATVSARLTDLSGNVATASTAYLIDKVAPTLAGLAADKAFVQTGATVTVTATASEPIKTATVTVSSGDTGACTCDGGACPSTSATPLLSCAVSVTHAASGSASSVTVTAADLFGNAVAPSVSYTTVAPPTCTGLAAGVPKVTRGLGTTLTAAFANGIATISNDQNSGVYSAVNATALDTGAIGATTIYTLHVTNAAGFSCTQTATVTAVDAPAITAFTSDSTSVAIGQPATLHASFTGGSARIDNDQGLAAITSVTSGAAVTTDALAANTTFTLTVTNTATTPASVTRSVSVLAGTAPVITSFTAPGNKTAVTVETGQSVVLTPVFSGGTPSLTDDHDANVVVPVSGQNVTVGPLTAATPTTFLYTLSVTNIVGQTATAAVSITVVPAPVCTSLIPAAASVTTGTGTTLTPTFQNGTGAITNSASGGTTPVSSGTAVQTGNLSGTTFPTTITYTLTVTSPALTTCTVQHSVSVVDVPHLTDFTATASGNSGHAVAVTSADNVQFTPTFSGGSAVITNDSGFANPSGLTTGALTAAVMPTLSGGAVLATYTLKVTNAATSPLSISASVTVNVVPAPTCSGLTASPTNVTAGDSASLTPVFSDGTGVIDNSVGPVLSNSAASTGALGSTGTTTWHLTVTNAAGATCSASASVNIFGAPQIASFTATTVPGGTGVVNTGTAVAITSGDGLTFTASFTNAAQAAVTNDKSLSNPSSISNGVATTAVTPTGTGLLATYTLTITNGAGRTGTKTVTVNVVSAPTCTSLAASPSNISLGDATQLTPTFSGGTGAIDNGIGTVGSGTAYSSGALNPALSGGQATVTFKLTVTNQAGTTCTTAGTNVTVYAAPAITSFVATNATSTVSGNAINYTVSDPNGVTFTAVFSGGTGAVSNTQGAPNPASITTAVATAAVAPGSVAAVSYLLTVTNALTGKSVSATAIVNVVAPPTCTTFNTSTPTVTLATPAILTPVFSNGAGSIDNGIGSVLSAAPVQSGNLSPALTNSTATVTFTLTVVNAAGGASGTCTLQRAITVNAAPVISAFTVANVPGGNGTTNSGAAISATSGDGLKFTGAWNIGTAAISNNLTQTNPGTVTNGVQTSAVTTSGAGIATYTLTVDNGAGRTVSQTVTVTLVAAPTCTSLTAPNSNNVTTGTFAVLTPSFSSGTGAIDNSVGAVSTGTPVQTGAVSISTTFHLTVTNPAGQTCQSAVTITPVALPVITSITISAPSSTTPENTISSGDGVQVTAVFSGSAGGTGALTNDGGAAGATLTSTVASATLTPSTTGVAKLITFTLSLTNAANTTVTGNATITSVPLPSITTFTASPTQVTGSTQTTLTWNFGNGAGTILDQTGATPSGITNPLASSNSTANLTLAASTTYTLSVTNSAGRVVSKSAAVSWVAAAPTCTSLTAAASTVNAGSTATLTPVFSGGSVTSASYKIDAGSTVALSGGFGSGSSFTSPALACGSASCTAAFTLVVDNGGGATCNLTANVTLVALPSITNFTPSAQEVAVNGSVTLKGIFSNGTGVVSGVGAVTSNVSSGSITMTRSRTFLLTVTNAVGTSVVRTTTVSVTGSMASTPATISPRFGATATRLFNGTILIAGGSSSTTVTNTTLNNDGTALLYDPVADAISVTGALKGARMNHVAVLMGDGRVLLAGGTCSRSSSICGSNANTITTNTMEIYDPVAGTFTQTTGTKANLDQARTGFTGTLLPNGNVLMAGGAGGSKVCDVVSLAAGSTAPGQVATPSATNNRTGHTATLLPNGKVLLFAGSGTTDGDVDLFDYTTNSFTASGLPTATAYSPLGGTATLMPNGLVLLAGGVASGTNAALYDFTQGASGTFYIATVGQLAVFRTNATATLLPDGRVFIEGGEPTGTASAELFDSQNHATFTDGQFTSAPAPALTQSQGVAALLGNGKVYFGGGNTSVAGSGQLFDPLPQGTQTFTVSSSLSAARSQHTSTLLWTGKLLVTGGVAASDLASEELVDPYTGVASAALPLGHARRQHTATMMPNGIVLVAGGLSSASTLQTQLELFNNGAVSQPAGKTTSRYAHTATVLRNGKVLLAGGFNAAATALATADLYDVGAGTVTATAGTPVARAQHTATALGNGLVLLVAGLGSGGADSATADLYDPAADTFTAVASPPAGLARHLHTATLLPSGDVLIAGGFNGTTALSSAYLYDPVANSFALATDSLSEPRGEHTATLLPGGQVLLVGGRDSTSAPIEDPELYDFSAGTFSFAGSPGLGLYRHSTTLLGNGRVAVTGGTASTGTSAAVLMFQ